MARRAYIRWTRLHEAKFTALVENTRVDLEEVGRSEFGEKRPRWLVRVNLELVDAAGSIAEAKRLAEQCVRNLEY